VPKRVVDGEALWLSEKVRGLPAEYRMHYANWLPLAEANGVFEASPARIHARIYSYLLPNMTTRVVKRIRDAFVDAGLLQLWDEEGKTWGYFIGIEKTGRLPSMKHLARYANLPPNPPVPDNPGQDGTSPEE
jgi:hypothetical protein